MADKYLSTYGLILSSLQYLLLSTLAMFTNRNKCYICHYTTTYAQNHIKLVTGSRYILSSNHGIYEARASRLATELGNSLSIIVGWTCPKQNRRVDIGCMSVLIDADMGIRDIHPYNNKRETAEVPTCRFYAGERPMSGCLQSLNVSVSATVVYRAFLRVLILVLTHEIRSTCS